VEDVGIEPTDLLITSLHLSRVLHYRPARLPVILLYIQLLLQLNYLVPPVRFELTYHTPLFERGDFTKFVHRGICVVDVARFELALGTV
jgi:hypothetical protein